MTQEDRQLLLKDICARLPYELKVKCEKYPFPVTVLYAGNINEVKFVETGGIEHICLIKPYLRSMSSMTEEEKKVVCSMNMISDTELNDRLNYQRMYVQSYTIETFDYFNAHHFDYRGLIEKSLALVAPEDMYKIG